MADGPELRGGCECGRIRYTTKRVPSEHTWCFCKQCQRVSGAPFLPFVDFAETDVVWTTEPDVVNSSVVAQRGFCNICGSTLSMRYLFQPGKLSIALGTLDKDSQLSKGPSQAIFLQDKPAWYQLPDMPLKQYDGHQTEGDFLKRLHAWEETHSGSTAESGEWNDKGQAGK
jgi:hypothetical protein